MIRVTRLERQKHKASRFLTARVCLRRQNDAMETSDSCDVGPLDVSIKKENTQEDVAVKPKMDIEKYCSQFNNNGQVVEALKARIRELESVSKTGGDKFTCLLCKVSTTLYCVNAVACAHSIALSVVAIIL